MTNSTSHSPWGPQRLNTMEVARTEERMLRGLHPDDHRHQQTPGPGQDGFHHPAPGRVLLFEAQTIQGAQGKEGGFGHGEEGHQKHQAAHGQPANEIGI